MTHEEIQHRLVEYLAGRLPEADRRPVEAHLASCTECEEFVEDLRPLPGILARHGAALFEDHPDLSALRRLRDGRPEAADGDLTKHLAVCASCSLQMSDAAPAAGGLGLQGAAEPRRRTVPPLLRWAGLLAAGVVLGLLLAPLTVRAPSGTDGPIDLPVLARVTRGGPGESRILVRPGQSSVVIAIPLDSLQGRSAEERIHIRLSTADGRSIYSLEGAAADLARASGASGVLPLMIEASRLPDGAYEVAIGSAGDPGEAIAVFPLSIVTGAGR